MREVEILSVALALFACRGSSTSERFLVPLRRKPAAAWWPISTARGISCLPGSPPGGDFRGCP